MVLLGVAMVLLGGSNKDSSILVVVAKVVWLLWCC